jgi:carboxymethylenebutenolidase
MRLTSSVRNNSASAIDNLQSAVNYVKSLEIVNGGKVASLGWCFGGDWSVQLALNSSENPLAATIVYYGRPVTDTASLLASLGQYLVFSVTKIKRFRSNQ